MTNAPAIGQLSTTASMVSVGMGKHGVSQPPAGYFSVVRLENGYDVGSREIPSLEKKRSIKILG